MKRKSLLVITMTLILATFVNMFAGMTVFADTDTTEFTEIGTPEQLIAVTNDLAGNYKLTADIDLSDENGNKTEWTPFGTFSGTFDGNGYTISGFTVADTTTANAGLFEEISKGGTVKNLTIANASFSTSTSTHQVGAFAGVMNGTLYGCMTESNVSVVKDGDKDIANGTTVLIGGLAGFCGNSDVNAKIQNCINNATVTLGSNNNGTGCYAGGIAGRFADGTIEYCINNGNVTIEKFTRNGDIKGDSQIACGGIVAWLASWNGTVGTIQNCVNNGNVSAVCQKNSSAAGGIVGRLYSGAGASSKLFNNNYNFGTISGNGGTVVSTDNGCGDNSGYVGQLIGRIASAYTGNENYGIGDVLYGISSGSTNVQGLNSATEAEMKAQSVYQSIITKELSTAEELELFARNFSTTYVYKLKNDIDLGGANWTPVETFDGNFDGNGYTVSNFTVSGTTTEAAGFFSTVTGTVTNLTLADAQIYSSASSRMVGAIAGLLKGTVSGCTTDKSVTVETYADGKHSGEFILGGIVGYSDTSAAIASNITYCINNADVTVHKSVSSTGGTLATYVGGIAGRCGIGSISYCINNGNVTVADYTNKKGNQETACGGITGRFGSWSDYTVTLNNCVNNGTVISDSTNNSKVDTAAAGGIIGKTTGGSSTDKKTMSDNYNFGAVKSGTWNTTYVGQIVGTQANALTSTNNYGVTDNGVLYGSTVTFDGMSSDTEANLKASATYASVINAIKENNPAFEVITTEYVGYQTSALSGGKFDVRFIGTFSGYFTDDYTKCDNVGFKISLSYTDTDGTPHNLSPEGGVITRTTMYSSILATDGQGNESTTTHTAKSLGGDYIFVMVCKGLPAEVQDGTDIAVTIQTFYTPIGSDPVYGEEMTITVTAPADTLA